MNLFDVSVPLPLTLSLCIILCLCLCMSVCLFLCLSHSLSFLEFFLSYFREVTWCVAKWPERTMGTGHCAGWRGCWLNKTGSSSKMFCCGTGDSMYIWASQAAQEDGLWSDTGPGPEPGCMYLVHKLGSGKHEPNSLGPRKCWVIWSGKASVLSPGDTLDTRVLKLLTYP